MRARNGSEPKIFTPDALEGLKQRVKTAPDDGGLWSGPKVARWLAKFHASKSIHDQRGFDALAAIGYSIQRPRPRHPESAGEAERPIALGHHRFEWLYLTGFAEPATGATVRNISNGIGKRMCELVLAGFARPVGAGPNKRIVLQLGNAGWHGPENLPIPEGVRLVHQPPYSPELQPAEHLREFAGEPPVNTYFETLADLGNAAAKRCLELIGQRQTIRDSALFHRWPKFAARK